MMKLMKRFGSMLAAAALLGAAWHSSGLKGEVPGSPEQVRPAAAAVTDTLSAVPALTVEPVFSSVSFAIDSLCVVRDGTHALDGFFRELEMLRQGKDTVISIVHLGDSHIQCGYLTGQLMRSFHRDFGNAGRGLIVPLKLTRTNEPDDYFIRSSITDWMKGRCIQRTPACEVGVGGIGIQTTVRKVNMDVIIAENNGAGYGFNQAVLFRHPLATPLVATGVPRDSVRTVTGKEPLCPQVVCDTFRIGRLTDTLLLRSSTLLALYRNLYYGLSLTNGRPGVLYHSIGVNGAMFVNYTDPGYIRQLALLRPSLLIISLGTNETFGSRFNSSEFEGQVDRFFSLVRQYLPGTALLLTTPPECFVRKRVNKTRVYRRNANTDAAARTLTRYAARNGIACWDLYAATGGKESSSRWQKAGMFGRDRIHFTQSAYREQGNLLYGAFVKEYNDFIDRERQGMSVVQPDSTVAYVVQ